MSTASRPPALTPFRVRSFRFQWPADLLTSCAFEMETLILGWYVLVETGSVVMLAVFGALQYIGTLIAPMFGVVGDRLGHRNLLCGMRAIYAALAAALMVLAFAGVLNPMLVLVIAALNGIVRPSDQGVRAALVAEYMPPAHLVGAMAISRTTSDAARVAGALTGAGLFAVLGMGPAYIVVAGSYVLGLVLTLGVTPMGQRVVSTDPASDIPVRTSPWRDLTEGIAYIWTTPHLLAAMWFAFLANLVAFPISNGVLPYVARDIYGTDQTGLGYLVASGAIGALVGSIALTFAGSRIYPGRMLVAFAAAWYAMLLVFAHMQGAVVGGLVLLVAGFMQSLSMVPLTVILLRGSSEKFRGRVMGVRMLAIYSLPLGLLGAGALIERIGFAATATLYSVTGLAFTLLIAARWRASLWQLDAPANAR
ncbi:MAG TPA: MFS transporter [Xanthobacteraceae bacterium]|nr:MFS transporter [Xanthobacteraceae bacterium]